MKVTTVVKAAVALVVVTLGAAPRTAFAAVNLRGGDAGESPELKDFRSVDITVVAVGPHKCCRSLTARCLACTAGLTLKEFCALRDAEGPGNPIAGCPVKAGSAVPKSRPCCLALTAQCMACAQGISVEKFCLEEPNAAGCVVAPDVAGLASDDDLLAADDDLLAPDDDLLAPDDEVEYEVREYEYEVEGEVDPGQGEE